MSEWEQGDTLLRKDLAKDHPEIAARLNELIPRSNAYDSVQLWHKGAGGAAVPFVLFSLPQLEKLLGAAGTGPESTGTHGEPEGAKDPSQNKRTLPRPSYMQQRLAEKLNSDIPSLAGCKVVSFGRTRTKLPNQVKWAMECSIGNSTVTVGSLQRARDLIPSNVRLQVVGQSAGMVLVGAADRGLEHIISLLRQAGLFTERLEKALSGAAEAVEKARPKEKIPVAKAAKVIEKEPQPGRHWAGLTSSSR
jgi:hypothetical protein